MIFIRDGTKPYTVINAHSAGGYEMVTCRIGNSVLVSDAVYNNFRSGYGLYDYAHDKFFDLCKLGDSYKQYENLEENLLQCGAAMPAADTDNDGKVTIMDATAIQMKLAGLI